MANNESVALIVEVQDKATADLDRVNDKLKETAGQVKSSEKSTAGSTRKMSDSFESFGDKSSRSIGRFSNEAKSGFGGAGERLKSFTDRISSSGSSFRSFVSGGTRGIQNFVSGFKDSDAAASSFTGRLGSIGGLASRGATAISRIGGALSPAISAAGTVASGIGNIASSAVSAGASIARDIGSSLADGVVQAGKLAGVLGGLTLGVAAQGGISRAINIEEAEARLRGLDFSQADISGIMDDSSRALQGTSFGLDEAAGAAATFANAGIEAGEDMENVLSTVGDAAFLGQTSFEDMGNIFGRVAAYGKMDGMTLNQVLDRNITSIDKMADHFGVTGDELRKMVSDGKISFEDFAGFMEESIGGAAAQMSTTTMGAIRDIRFGLAIVGADVAGPFMQILRGVGNAIAQPLYAVAPLLSPIFAVLTEQATAWADSAAEAGTRAAERLTAMAEPMEKVADLMRDGMPLFEAFQEVFDFDTSSGLGGFVSDLIPLVSDLAPLLGAAGGGLLALATGVGRAIPLIGRFIPVLNPLLGIIIGLVAASPELRSALMDALTSIGGVLAEVAPLFGDAFSGVAGMLGPLIAEIVTVIAEGIVMFGPFLGDLIMLGAELITGLLPALVSLVPVAVEFIGALAGIAAMVAGGIISVLPFFADILVTIVEAVSSAVSWLLSFDDVMSALVWTVSAIAGGMLAYNAAMTAVRIGIVLYHGVVGAATTATRIFNTVLRMNPIGLIVTGIMLLVAALTWFFTQTETGKGIWASVWGFIKDTTAAVVGWFTDTALPAMQAFWQGIVDAAMIAWDFVSPVFDWIAEAIAVTIDWLVNTALPVVQAFWAGFVEGAMWLWSYIEPVLTWIIDAWIWVGQLLMTIYLTVILIVWELFAGVVMWLWESIILPVFGFIAEALQWLGEFFVNLWSDYLSPFFSWLGDAFSWLWENVISPVIGWVIEKFQEFSDFLVGLWLDYIWPTLQAIGEFFVMLWEEYVGPALESLIQRYIDMALTIWSWWTETIWPALQALADFFVMLWEEYISPALSWIIEKYIELAFTIYEWWNETILPALQAFGDFVMSLYYDYISPALGWIGDKWTWLKDTLYSIWHDGIKPIFQAVGDFVMDEVVPRIADAVNMIGDIWDGITGVFKEPINWVLENVWNNGIVSAFNKASETIGFGSTLPKASLIGGGGSGGSGNRANIPGYAEGGVMGSGLKLVGEEGPELITTGPGWVATANETKQILGSDHPADQTTQYGVGGSLIGKAWDWVKDETVVGEAISWARGGLASAAGALLKPLLEPVTGKMSEYGHMGEAAAGFVDATVDGLMEWISGEDQQDMGGDFSDVPFTANPGGFNRPAGGPITSKAGPRSYFGAFGNMHYGVDIGVPIDSPVRAAYDGVVKSRGGGGLNQIVVLNHGGFDTAYMHNSAILKSPGTGVKGGDIIARSGTAGSGPHLHFEVHPGGYYNPSIARANALFDEGGVLKQGRTSVLNNSGENEFVFTGGMFGQVVDLLDMVTSQPLIDTMFDQIVDNLDTVTAEPAPSGGVVYADSHDVTFEQGSITVVLQGGAAGGMSAEDEEQLREKIADMFEEAARRAY